MRRFLTALILLAGCVGAADMASAQYYYDRGYYPPPPPRAYYRDRYYGEERYYRPPPQRRYGPYRTWNGCPPGWTVQDGTCKPYSGR